MVGGSANVGAAGGWVMGGGHGPFSPEFGLGVFTAISIYFSHTYTNDTTT